MKRIAAQQTYREAGEAAGAGGCAKKAYDFLEKGEDALEINMYGEIVQSIPIDFWTGEPVDGLFISEKDFLKDLDKYRGKGQITIRINSVGGDLYAGLAIANRLRDLKADIVTIADALCASAAVSIYQAGHTRKLYTGSQIMIHEPSCMLFGRYDVQEIKKVQMQLEACKKSLIESYRERTGRTLEELEQMITGNCWMTGQEAVTEGFADEVIEGEVTAEVTEDNKTVISNGICFPATAFYSMPRHLKVHSDHVKNGITPDKNKKKKEGEVLMTKSELMEKYPDLCNEISSEAREGMQEAVDKAVRAERDRIQNIDEIAGQVGDKDMVREAKFGENPMDASQLALAALKKQSKVGSDFMNDMLNDAKNSNAEAVTPNPNSGTKSREEQEYQDIMDGAALIIGKKEGGQE